VISKAEWALRKQQWASFNRWERAQPRPEYSAEDTLASLSTILEWIPASVKLRERDPDRRGVRRMHALLALLSAISVR
jgi:hypothetical protein